MSNLTRYMFLSIRFGDKCIQIVLPIVTMQNHHRLMRVGDELFAEIKNLKTAF